MQSDLEILHRMVAECVMTTRSEQERSVLRSFGSELGAVQRRIQCRKEPPTEEEIEIALTCVLALAHRRTSPRDAEYPPS